MTAADGIAPHAGQPVVEAGAPLGQGNATAIMIHGRGAGPENILDLVPALARPRVTYLAPTAANRTWYPNRFMTDLVGNEPALSSALAVIAALVARVEQTGIPRSRIVLLGFSQGACLTAEFAVRHPARYAGIILFTGGLIGPAGTVWNDTGDFASTPIFLGSGDPDSHVPVARVSETAGHFERMGARVTTRVYPGRGHFVSDAEVDAARALLDEAAQAAAR